MMISLLDTGLVRANITRLRIYGLKRILIDASLAVTSAWLLKIVAHQAAGDVADE